jgi:hypothetical protein
MAKASTAGAIALAADVPAVEDEIAVMARNGIVRVPANHYLVDGYRYTNLADALAQVNRGARGRAETV